MADLNVGLLYILAIAGLAVYAVLFAGWSSNNKYSLLGSLRASAQTLSYEVFLGLSLMGIVIQTGSFNLRDIVEAQAGMWNVIPRSWASSPSCLPGSPSPTATRLTSRRPSRSSPTAITSSTRV